MARTTLEDALHAAQQMRAASASVGTKLVVDFLEPLSKMTKPSVIGTDRDGFIVEGAFQNGFEMIDDDGSLLVVHQNDLIAYVKKYRDAPAREPIPAHLTCNQSILLLAIYRGTEQDEMRVGTYVRDLAALITGGYIKNVQGEPPLFECTDIGYARVKAMLG